MRILLIILFTAVAVADELPTDNQKNPRFVPSRIYEISDEGTLEDITYNAFGGSLREIEIKEMVSVHVMGEWR